MDAKQKEEEAFLRTQSFDTRCVQSGSAPNSAIGSIVTPIDLSTLFEKTDTRLPGNGKPFLYTRLGNPTRLALETQISSIFQLNHCTVTNNISAAYYSFSLNYNCQTDGILVISQREPFKEMIKKIFAEGPQSFGNFALMDNAPTEIDKSVKLVILELVQTKDMTVISDEQVKALNAMCKAQGAHLIVDISTGYQMIKRHEFSDEFDYMVADLSYFAGIQGNAGAAILANDQAVFAKVQGVVNFIGNGLQPMDCFMTQRGLKTLGLRLDHQLKASEALTQKLRDKGLDATSVAGILKIANEEKNEEALVRFKRGPKQSSNVTHLENQLVFLGIEEVDDLFEELLKVYI
ncbi:hypothetical protein FGO68_gene6233 [Halteria grandinella]|uniref:Uncharacterized protein n=1 Tax=Halteria grandinella TaxID=5974 RepID=A0A8J8NL89_HALGN|nr:hypothetical protein FGO68_gene6233 [Halteria grandinella]